MRQNSLQWKYGVAIFHYELEFPQEIGQQVVNSMKLHFDN